MEKKGYYKTSNLWTKKNKNQEPRFKSVMSLNCLFFLSSRPKPKDMELTIIQCRESKTLWEAETRNNSPFLIFFNFLHKVSAKEPSSSFNDQMFYYYLLLPWHYLTWSNWVYYIPSLFPWYTYRKHTNYLVTMWVRPSDTVRLPASRAIWANILPLTGRLPFWWHWCNAGILHPPAQSLPDNEVA